jgi:PLP dependent protein
MTTPSSNNLTLSELTLAERLVSVHQCVETIVNKSNRKLTPVKLLAVSKTFPSSDIELAYQTGQREFGENYVQEVQEKTETLAQLTDIVWHFIGPLQSNKTKYIAEKCHWLHTLERLKIAQRLNTQRPASMPTLQVLIQVNISEDENKSGILLDEVNDFAQQLQNLEQLELRGLMAIPAKGLSELELSKQYQSLKNKQLELQKTYAQCDQLSIGMSGDMEIAIESGATIVRIGTAIFGKRELKRQS